MFAKIDTEAQRELAQACEITSIPTPMIVREQITTFGQPGAVPGAALDDLIHHARSLDMDTLRAAGTLDESFRCDQWS